ncbi:hypothetical protein AVEN_44493-1, partial [Araneus ventricosus]
LCLPGSSARLVPWRNFYPPAVPHSLTYLAHLSPDITTSRENRINSYHPLMVIFSPSPSVTIGGSTKERLSLDRLPLFSGENAHLFPLVSDKTGKI